MLKIELTGTARLPSHCSLKLDSLVSIQIDYSRNITVQSHIQVFEQVSKSQSIVGWNGNGRKQVIGAFNSNGMLVVLQPPGLLMGADLCWLGHLFNVSWNGNGRK